LNEPRPHHHAAAVAHLRAADPVLAGIIAEAGDCTLTLQSDGTHFAYLLRAIVFQQLAGAAARTIHARVLDIFGGRAPTPAELLATPPRALRKAGLSAQKIRYVRDLAAHAAEGDVPLPALETMADDEIIAALTRVKGIGRWTAHMFLMFRLGRPDVLPELDYGVQKGMQVAYRLRKLPKPKRMHEVAARWAPHRTIGSWYMWRVLELRPPRRTVKAKPKVKAKVKVKAKPKPRSTPRRRA